MADQKLYKWGPKGMLVAKDSDPDDIKFTEKADLGLFGGPTSKIVKNLPGYAWAAKEMKAGTKYAKIADVQALMGGKPVPQPVPNPEPVPAPPAPTPVPPPPPPKAITSLRIQSTGDKVQANVPFTVGQVFAPGDLAEGKGLVGLLEDGTTIPLQFDVKALHSDGSVRHGVVSGVIPSGEPGKDIVVGLAPIADQKKGLVNAVAFPKVTLVFEGKTYRTGGNKGEAKYWLAGPIVSEMHTNQPFFDENGIEHPHLCARFGSRVYFAGQARLDLVIENAWAYEPEPRNFTYDVLVEFDGKTLYEKKALTHYHHARWRKLFWYGEEPQINVIHDWPYLDSTKALPHYDPSIVVPEKTLADWQKKWEKAGKGPMQVGLPQKCMGGTGGRPEIAIVPAWAVLWLLTGDKRMRDMTLGTADSAGSWSSHYRDRDTDQPISLIDYPYMTIYGRSSDTKNPATKKYEAFPALTKATSATPFSHDSAHQPGFSFVPYLLTGDHYHLEELQFWAMWCAFNTNPGYRKNVQGLVWRQQVRGIAWSLRTIAQAAWITPDSDRMKKHFAQIVESNFAPSVNPTQWVNPFGAYVGSGAVIYQGNTAIAPFQDDHLTSVLGYVVDLGFTCAEPMLEAKAKFPIQRLVGEGTNWRAAVNYTWPIKESPEGLAFETIGESYKALYAKLEKSADKDDIYSKQRLDSEGMDLSGYPTSTEGFPTNLQPAIAAAARFGSQGAAAWKQFMARDPKPNYGTGPQFAIVPRSV
jgi:hypothetical protein